MKSETCKQSAILLLLLLLLAVLFRMLCGQPILSSKEWRRGVLSLAVKWVKHTAKL